MVEWLELGAAEILHSFRRKWRKIDGLLGLLAIVEEATDASPNGTFRGWC